MSEKTTPSLIDLFSPPYSYRAIDNRVLLFRRMRMKLWGPFIRELREERMEVQNGKINKQVDLKDLEQRQRARMIAEMYIEENTGMPEVMKWATQDSEGIQRVLRYAAMCEGLTAEEWDGKPAVIDKETGKELEPEKIGYCEMISPPHQAMIASNIVHIPIVKTKNPTSPDGSKQQTDTAGQNQNPNPTGKKSRKPSKPTSSATPAS